MESRGENLVTLPEQTLDEAPSQQHLLAWWSSEAAVIVSKIRFQASPLSL